MQEKQHKPPRPAFIIDAEQFDDITRDIKEIKQKQQFHDTVLRRLGWVSKSEAMSLTGIKSLNGIKAAASRGELEMRYKSEKVLQFSMASILDYLTKKGIKIAA